MVECALVFIHACSCFARMLHDLQGSERARHAGKKPEQDVFDHMDATDLNTKLKDLMPELSVKASMCCLPCQHVPVCISCTVMPAS